MNMTLSSGDRRASIRFRSGVCRRLTFEIAGSGDAAASDGLNGTDSVNQEDEIVPLQRLDDDSDDWKKAMDNNVTEASKRWGFDFNLERPLAMSAVKGDGNNGHSTDSVWDYDIISTNNAGSTGGIPKHAKYVPSFYKGQKHPYTPMKPSSSSSSSIKLGSPMKSGLVTKSVAASSPSRQSLQAQIIAESTDSSSDMQNDGNVTMKSGCDSKHVVETERKTDTMVGGDQEDGRPIAATVIVRGHSSRQCVGDGSAAGSGSWMKKRNKIKASSSPATIISSQKQSNIKDFFTVRKLSPDPAAKSSSPGGFPSLRRGKRGLSLDSNDDSDHLSSLDLQRELRGGNGHPSSSASALLHKDGGPPPSTRRRSLMR